MSRGLVRVQRECLRVIEQSEAAGQRPTTFNIAAEIYQIEQDSDGNRWISEAQYVATKRALANLRRKGLVLGQQETSVCADGNRIFRLPQAPSDGRDWRWCYFWSIAR